MYFVVILFGVIPLSYSQRLDFPQSYIKTTQLDCKFNPEWVANVSCKLKPVSWEKSLTNITFDLVKPLTNVTANLEFFRRETRFLPFFINVTRNFCEILAKKGLDYYTKYALDLIQKFMTTKLPTSCPITGHIEVVNAYIDAGYFKFMLINGVYLVVMNAFEGYPPQWVGSFEIIVVTAEKIRNKRKDPKKN